VEALQAVAAGSVQIAAIVVRMAPDGVTSQLRIVRPARGPSIRAQVPQIVMVVVDLRHLRHQHPQRRRHRRLQVQWSRDMAL